MSEQMFPCEWCARLMHDGSHVVRMQERHVRLDGALDPTVQLGRVAPFHRRCAEEARSTGEWTVAPRRG